MKNPLIAKLTAYAALCGAATAYAGVTPNLVDASGAPVRDASGACVQTSGINHPDCMPKKVEPPKTAPAPAPKPVEPPKPAPAPAPKPAPQPVKAAITIQAEALFDFDKSALKSEGKKSLDDAIAKLKSIDVEMIIATGHTDSVGTDAYNQKLSERRATTVKEYLVSQGISAAKVTTLGKGETQPIGTNKTADGRAKNRRVDIEFKGVQTK